jgi:hypothetical protein
MDATVNVETTKTAMRRSPALSADNVNTLALIDCRSVAIVRTVIARQRVTKDMSHPMTVSRYFPQSKNVFL